MKLADSKLCPQLTTLLKNQIIHESLSKRSRYLESTLITPPTPPPISPHLLANIVLDHLRSLNLNYSYSVFLRECGLSTRDVIQRQDILRLLPETQAQIGKSALEIIYSLVETRKEVAENGCQTTEKYEMVLPKEYYEERLRAVREELQGIMGRELEDRITRWVLEEKERIKEEIREDMHKQYEVRVKQEQYSNEIAKKHMKEKQKEFISVYTKKVEDLVAFQSKQTQQLNKLKEQNKQLMKSQKQHRCTDSQQYRLACQELSKQSKSLKQKQQQYKLALANINTSVQDIITQKKVLLQPSKPHLQIQNNNRGIDDRVAKNLLTSISNLESRVKLLTEQNSKHNQEMTTKAKKLMQLERELMVVRQKVPRIGEEGTAERAEQGRKKTKNIGVNVREDMLKEQQQQTIEEKQQEQQQEREKERQDVLDYLEELNRKKLQSIKSIEGIRIEMNQIKKKVRHLVEDPF